MSTKYTTNTFKKLDADTSVNKQDPTSFCDAVDLRLISDEALSNGALVNFKGTKAKIDLTAKYQLKGYTTIEQTLILLLYHPAEDAVVEHSAIASVELDDTDTMQEVDILYHDTSSVSKLNFGDVDSISCIGRYESDNSKKVYFAVGDKITPLRAFNVVQDELSIPITTEAYLMDIIPNNTNPEFSSISIIDGGNLSAGKIQYSCRLFKKYGAETAFSPSTKMISLTASSARDAAEFTGSDIETIVDKSISISIQSIDTNYDYLCLYSIFYATKDTPVISKVAEIEIPQTGIATIVDNGNILSSVTIEEFNTFGGRLFSAETIASKNNMLFAANITESSDDIDIDCRAYRFKLDGGAYKSRIYESDGTYYEIDDSGNWFHSSTPATVLDEWSIPVDADCINKYNDEFDPSNPIDQISGSPSLEHPFPYYKNSLGVIGGTGKIVSYTFELQDNVLLSGSSVISGGSGDTVVSISPTDSYEYTIQTSSRKQGDVYRDGVTFYDLKGKPFFTKWIGDIRIPYLNSFGVSTDGVDSSNVVIVYNIDLSLVPAETLANISGFHISSVERTDSDKSIVCQGATWISATDKNIDAITPPLMHKSFPLRIGGAGVYVDTNDWESVGSWATDSRKAFVHPFYSPELYYNGGIDSIDGNYIAKVVAAYTYNRKSFDSQNPVTTLDVVIGECSSLEGYSASNLLFPREKFSGSSITSYDSLYKTFIGGNYTVIDSMKMSRRDYSNAPYIINYGAASDSTEFYNRVLPYNANTTDGATWEHMTMYGPSCGLFSTKVGLAKMASSYDYVFIIDLYKNNASTRYGGNTYEARSLNVYKPNSQFIQYVDASLYSGINTYGDSYNTIFDGFTSFHDGNINDKAANGAVNLTNETFRQQVVSLIPIESRINCTLASVKPSKYIFSPKYSSGKNMSDKAVGLQETEAQGVAMYGANYPIGMKNTNAYNTVYSQNQVYPTLVVKPTIFEPVSNMPSTIIASEIKYNGELVDSWTKFLYNNVIDVDSSFGPIHNLQHFNNKLYFFQEDGIGIAAVNERYVLDNNSPGQLSLGTGGILERFDYIKYNEGIVDMRHIVATNDSIYYIDNNRRVITSIDSATSSLSVLHGVNSLFRSLYVDRNTNVALGYNPIYKEVMFTVGSKTLVFNEHIDLFGPRHSCVPSMYVSLPGGLYSFVAVAPEPVSLSVSPLTTLISGSTFSGEPISVIADGDWSILNSSPSITEPTVDSSYIFKHGAGEYGELYSEIITDNTYRSAASISFVVNPRNTNINVFDTIDFRTDVIDDLDDVNQTISSMSFRNSNQYATKAIKIKPNNYISSPSFVANTSRRGRAWTTAVPLSIDANNPSGYGKRFVDSYLIVTMNFQNNANKKFRLHDVITYYREANKSR